ncbi:MAG: low temperature requirement protein A [Rhodobacteraceae bacterium]|nr:low temperature requirement protein A [Paracoccaceae bacterium]
MAGLLRAEDSRVGFVELFFDLVFVFAITQVSHFLLHHFSLRGAVEAAVIFLAVWWVWIYTTWVLNRLDPDAPAVRGMLFAMMFGGLFLSMAIPEAYGERGPVFAAAFVAMQAGRTAFMYRAARGDAVLRRTYLRILVWMALAGVFWIAGGLVAPGHRLAVWAVALAIDYAGPVLSFAVPGLGRDVTTNWTVRGGHIAERCGLFVIIALGETLLVSGATFAEMAWDATGLAAFAANVMVSVGMWWVYFNIGHRRAAHQIEQSDDPGRIARLSFTYAHIPIVAGVVLAAVGAERAIAHPAATGSWGDMAALAGGAALFVAGNGWFKRLSAARFPLSHLVGLGLLAAAAAAGVVLPLWLSSAAVAVALAVVGFEEDRSIGAGAAARAAARGA